MTTLFEKTMIGSMELGNRFVRSATYEGMAEQDGGTTDPLISEMVKLAANEVGLIITGYAFVAVEGQSSPGMLAAHDDRFVPGLARMAQAVHDIGGKIALQIVHGGRFASQKLTGHMPIGPSEEVFEGKTICDAMTTEDIKAATAAFALAAGRAKKAGFDAVQLHAAHGLLLSQFLCPAMNRRADEYGDSLENRARLLLEVIKAVRQTVGNDYPILVKLNAEDFVENGMTADESLAVCKLLEVATVNAIEFSGGTIVSGDMVAARPGNLKTPKDEVYYRESARRFKETIGIPLMLVGGIRSFETAEEIITDGLCDYIALSRPLISEPDLVKRWQGGDRKKARCISCNACFGPLMEGKGFYCPVFNSEEKK